MSKKRITYCKYIAVLGFVFIFLAANWKGESVRANIEIAPDDKPVEQVRKNIQVLKGMPDSQLFLVMNAVGDSLGVHCDYCHVKEGTNPKTGSDNWLWERDDKPQKLRAREMMKMVLDLNKTNFGGNQSVTCYSCHRGGTSVERVVPLPPRDLWAIAEKGEKKSALPTAEQILNRYVAAVGGQDAGAKFKTTVLKGQIERTRGRSGSFEITIKGADKYSDKLITPQGVTTRVINGTTGWVRSNDETLGFDKNNDKAIQVSPEAVAGSKRALALYDAVKVTEQPAQMTVLGVEKIGDRETYVVAVKVDPKVTRKYFFDAQTGLLSRTMTITETILSPLQTQVDFEDYRDVDGVKFPFTIRTSNVAAFDTTTRRFKEIRHNAAVEDALFEMPKNRQ